jgi:FAD/FMN-containing dehydrogenase
MNESVLPPLPQAPVSPGATLLAPLRALLGESSALIDTPQDMAPFLTDWRGRYTGRALAVLQPRTTQQVADAVRWCTGQGIAIVAQGGNTGLAGGATPDERGRSVVVSTRRLKRIRRIDEADDTITVEAGCILQQVQQAAQERGRLFPLSLAAEGSCTIGGNLATNAGGTQVLRYGNTRDLTLGLEVVLADGAIWDGLRGLRKDNSGYDLKQLFIGSEGTLGIITAATLRLFPLPLARIVCLVALPDFASAIRLLQRARAGAGPALTAFELMSGIAVDHAVRTLPRLRAPFAAAVPWMALLEWSEFVDAAQARERCENLCAAAIEAGDGVDALIAQSSGDADSLWRLRESLPEAQARTGGNVKHDISLPVSTMDDFISKTGAALEQLSPDLQAFVFGHLGDGNLHYNIGTRAGVDVAAAFEREEQINDIVFSAVFARGGSISAEHGIGQLRLELLDRFKDPLDRAMMRGIKQALDPKGLMNPGKVI